MCIGLSTKLINGIYPGVLILSHPIIENMDQITVQLYVNGNGGLTED